MRADEAVRSDHPRPGGVGEYDHERLACPGCTVSGYVAGCAFIAAAGCGAPAGVRVPVAEVGMHAAGGFVLSAYLLALP